MKRIVDWINSHKVITVCLAFLVLVVQPFFVHLFLKIPAPSAFFVREWDAGDLITYIAGFEAFIGTVFLGIVAVRQNDKANKLNERVVKIEEDSCLFTRYPNLLISSSSTQRGPFKLVFDKKCAVYSCIDNIDELLDDEESANQIFYLFPFTIQNLSGFNVRYKVTSMTLSNRMNDSSCFIYRTTPFNLHPEILILAPNSSYSIGLLVDQSVIKNDFHRGIMNLSVKNHINEEFFYTTVFDIVISPRGETGFIIKDQFDVRLSESQG